MTDTFAAPSTAQRASRAVTDPDLIRQLDAAAAQRPPQQIRAPNGDVVEFPDGTPDSVITSVMRREYGGPEAPAAQRPPNVVTDAALIAELDAAANGPNKGSTETVRDPNQPMVISEWLFGGPEFDERRKAELERASTGVGDIGRGMARGITLNNADEIVAWLRSKFGSEAYDAALTDERRLDRETRERSGTAGTIASEAVGSLALPVKGVMAGYRALAPAGSSALRRGSALAATSAPLNAVSVYGDMENKDLGTAAVVGTATSAAFAPVAATGIMVGRAGWRLGSDVAGRLAEWLNLRRGIPVRTDSGTQRFAVRQIADAFNEGGVRTTADVQAAMRANEVPHTDMALVNSGNDRATQLALEQARLLVRPNVPQAIPGGRVVTDNIFENLQHNQSIDAMGRPQHEALTTRIQNDFNIPLRERNPVRVEERANAEIERHGDRIADLRTPIMGQAVADTPLPGFVVMLESDPAAAAAYRRATAGVSLPGQTGIPRDLVPLHGRDYERALAAWEARRDAAIAAGRPFADPPPAQISDSNVPIAVLQNMLADASATTQSDDAIKRNLGINLHRVLTELTERAPMGSGARELREANRSIGVARTAQEDLTAGRRMPTQEAPPLTAALAEHPTLPPERQLNRRRGYVQGVVDQINANTDNIGSIPGTIVTDPLRVQAYNAVARSGTTSRAPSAEALARELSNVGNMQDTAAGLLAASRRRESGGSLPEQAARAYAGWNFSPTVGVTRAVVTWLGGMTQARRGEIARLLVDTTGEGQQLLERELTRRVSGYNGMNADSRRAVILELSRQLSDASAEALQ